MQNQQVPPAQPSNNQDIESGQQNQQVSESDSRSWHRGLSSQDFKLIVLFFGVANAMMSTMVLGGMSLHCQSSHPEPKTPKEPGYNMTQFLDFKNQQFENKKDCENRMGPYATSAVILVNIGVLATYFFLKRYGYFESRRIGEGEGQVNADVVFAQEGTAEEVASQAVASQEVRVDNQELPQNNLQPFTTRNARSLDLAPRTAEGSQSIKRPRSL